MRIQQLEHCRNGKHRNDRTNQLCDDKKPNVTAAPRERHSECFASISAFSWVFVHHSFDACTVCDLARQEVVPPNPADRIGPCGTYDSRAVCCIPSDTLTDGGAAGQTVVLRTPTLFPLVWFRVDVCLAVVGTAYGKLVYYLFYYGLPITCRFFRTKRVRRLSNRNVAVRFSLFSLVSQ